MRQPEGGGCALLGAAPSELGVVQQGLGLAVGGDRLADQPVPHQPPRPGQDQPGVVGGGAGQRQHAPHRLVAGDRRGVRLEQSADRTPVLRPGVGADGGGLPAGRLQQAGGPGVEGAGGPAAELVDQQHLEMGLEHLVVVVGQPPVGAGGEELLRLQLGEHRGPAAAVEQVVADVPGQHAEGAGPQQEGAAFRGQALQARCGPGRSGSAATVRSARRPRAPAWPGSARRRRGGTAAARRPSPPYAGSAPRPPPGRGAGRRRYGTAPRPPRSGSAGPRRRAAGARRTPAAGRC